MHSTDRYNSTSGTFTVPPGGDGFYYFSVYLLVLQSHVTVFDIAINEQIICTAYAEQLSSSDDENTSCTAVSYAAEGVTNHLSFSCSLLIINLKYQELILLRNQPFDFEETVNSSGGSRISPRGVRGGGSPTPKVGLFCILFLPKTA